MKLTLILSMLTIFQLRAIETYSQFTKLTINLEDVKISDALKEIENQSEFFFLYSPKLIDVERKVNLKAENEPIKDILADMFDGNVKFAVYDRQIILTPSDKLEVLSINQQRRVIGRIVDPNGNPLVGVTVVEKNTTNGTLTDQNGNYSINVKSSESVLAFSFIGFSSQEITVGMEPQINLTLTEASHNLDEVVVVSYGTQSKRKITGSMQSISSVDIKNINVAQAAQSLQGKLANVQISQGTGIPGADLIIRIRGAASISGTLDPLYVIDGFPIDGNMSNINPEEIETITVMKDAASTALYGSRAANGVVMITTKRATAGKMVIGFNASHGVQVLPMKGRPDLMNGTEFAQYSKERYEDAGQPVPLEFQNPSQYGVGTNWYDVMFRTAPTESYSLSLMSRTEKVGVSAVLGYSNMDGIMINSGYTRYSLRINTDFNLSDKLKAGFNIAPTYSKNYAPPSDGIFWQGGVLSNALISWPIVKYRNDDGTLPITAYIPGTLGYPHSNFYRSALEIVNNNSNMKLLSNAFISYEPIKGLVLKSSIDVQLGEGNSKYFQPSTSSTSFAQAPPVTANLNLWSNQSSTWLSENTANYKKSIGDHNFEMLAGFTTQKSTLTAMNISASNFPDDRISTVASALQLNKGGTWNDKQEWSMISYIGRLNYDFKGKYLFAATIREDGCSRFGADTKWGYFPSVSLGWVVSDESFFPKNNVVNLLKVRGSYGLTGNNNIGNYTTNASVDLSPKAVFGTNVESGSYVSSLESKKLTWETTSQLDLGADIVLMNNRISIGYDYYFKKTYSMLYYFPIASSSGFNSLAGNSGELHFWGHEIVVTSKNMVGNFKWTTSVNISFGDNKVASLGPYNNYLITGIDIGNHISKVGQGVGLFWGMVRDGVYKNQADYDNSPHAEASAVGTAKFKDLNHDGVILNTDTGGDLTVIGDPTPKYLFGITNSFSYKDFDLTIVASGSQGNDIYNRYQEGNTDLDGAFNVLKDVKYRWRSPENPGLGKYGTTTVGTYMERDWPNDRYISDGSFLTIKNLTLGYSMNVSKIKFISKFRVYASVQQLYTFTKYKGNNPEVSNGTSALNLGDDIANYPIPRVYTFGINIEF